MPYTGTTCQVGALPVASSTVYYAPDDNHDVQLYGTSFSACGAPGSTYAISFYSGSFPSGTFLANCGCLPLDGNVYYQDCGGLTRSSLPDGPYYFSLGSGSPFHDPFKIVHEQVSVTASAATTVVTSTSTDTYETTTMSTITVMATSTQTTVTSPAATSVSVITSTPAMISSTTTSTTTITRNVLRWTLVATTKTYTASCTSLALCPTSQNKQIPPSRLFKQRDLSLRPKLAKRDCVGPNCIGGDGPVTTTITPPPVISTVTASTTSVGIDTAYATTIITVAPTPLTSTFYTGQLNTLSTTTLVAVTTVLTAHTKTKVTKTIVIPITWTVVSRVTPICSEANKKGG